jgi:hypothetical protein
MSMRFSSTALRMVATIWDWPRAGAVSFAAEAGAARTAVTRASPAMAAGSFGCSISGLCFSETASDAGAWLACTTASRSSWVATEVASCLTSPPSSLISLTTD